MAAGSQLFSTDGWWIIALLAFFFSFKEGFCYSHVFGVDSAALEMLLFVTEKSSSETDILFPAWPEQ